MKEELLRIIRLQFKKEYRKLFTEKSLDWVMSLPYIYFLFDFIFDEPPLNKKTRKAADKMQELYHKLKLGL